MLTWTEHTDGWHANGFRIESVAPFRWRVLDNQRTRSPVSLEEEPLAVTRTLTEAKREAELVADARRRAELRKKHFVILGLIFGSGTVLLGDAPVQNIGVVIVLATLATRSLGVIVGTILSRSYAANHEVFYQ